jgi:gliding motility-associated-like protein
VVANAHLKYNAMRNVMLSNSLTTRNDGSGQKTHQSTSCYRFLIAILLLFWLPWVAQAQAPVISYSSPKTYGLGTLITPLAPVNSAGAVGAPGYSNTTATIASGLYLPWDVATDAAGNVYMVDWGTSVYKIPVGGGARITLSSAFNTASGVAVDRAGNVYVSDWEQGIVKMIPAGGGAPVTICSGISSLYLAVDVSGNVYIADYYGGTIIMIPAGGGARVTLASGFNLPCGIAVDAAGNVYEAEYDSGVVKKIPKGGGALVTIGTVDIGYGVAVDAAGNVFAGCDCGVVTEFPVGGGASISIGSGFSRAAGVAVDGAGNVYVAAEFNGSIDEIKPVGGYYIDPFLPAGLSFDNQTGVISGTPIVGSPATNYTVTAYNAAGSGTATVNIETVGKNANLANLTLSLGTLTPVFATATKSYTALVGNAATSLTITPTASDPLATISVNGVVTVSGAASAAIPLAVGVNTITTIVTAQDGVTTNTYTLVVTRAPSSNAGLAGLAVSAGLLSPSFATGTNNYIDPVDIGTTSLTITPTLADNTATATVNGSAVASGSASASIPLAIGHNTIAIVVTAQDGITTNIYTLTVNRVAPTKNAGLVSIRTNPSESALVGVIGPGYLNYTAVVTNTTTSIQVIPTAADPNATITVNGSAVVSGYPSAGIPLTIGTNTITTVITAAVGTSTRTILLIITREGPSNNAEIASITTNPRESALVEAAGPGYLNYTEAVTNSTTSIQVIATAKQQNATITINGITAISGSPSSPITLSVGANVITTIVTAPDGVSTKTVIITVNRAGPSNNAELASVSTNPRSTLIGTTGEGYLNYEEYFANNVSSVAVIPTAKDPNATITVNSNPVASGTASPPIALNVGANLVSIAITAQDGITAKSIMITVNRAAAPVFNAFYQPGLSVVEPQASVSIENDGIAVHPGVSPNSDGINDFLQIDGITAYPENKLTIVNRNGALVYEAQGYDNISKVFDGHASKTGIMQLPGTYFYALDYSVNGATKHKTGYIVLKY